MAGPCAGKTLLARAMPGVLPDMANLEALEVTKIYSVSGTLREGVSLIRQRPFRPPHHTISNAGLGGGRQPRPGEISLSRHGVLFLDELPEFGVAAPESLRQPLEDRRVTIALVSGVVTYPADFMLIAAMNPCPCALREAQEHRAVISQHNSEPLSKEFPIRLSQRHPFAAAGIAGAVSRCRAPSTL